MMIINIYCYYYYFFYEFNLHSSVNIPPPSILLPDVDDGFDSPNVFPFPCRLMLISRNNLPSFCHLTFSCDKFLVFGRCRKLQGICAKKFSRTCNSGWPSRVVSPRLPRVSAESSTSTDVDGSVRRKWKYFVKNVTQVHGFLDNENIFNIFCSWINSLWTLTNQWKQGLLNFEEFSQSLH